MSCSFKCLIISGLGGTIPTISRLASTYVTDPSTPMPEYGLYFGLLLFFGIGSILAYAFSETNLRQAFIMGICAPAIITNIMAGASDTRSDKLVSYSPINFGIISNANAQETLTTKNKDLKSDNKQPIPLQELPKIIIKTGIAGGRAWDLKHTPVTLEFIKEDGSTIYATDFIAIGDRVVSAHVPNEATAIKVGAGNRTETHKLPEAPFTSAVLNTQIKIKGTNDFMWALGAKRKPKVTEFNSYLSEIKLNDK